MVFSSWLLKNGTHIGHDAQIGEDVVVACGAKIGGHVTVGDGAFIGLGASVVYGRLVNGGAPRSVPVEDQGGPGTRDSHWRERTFGPELMTGYVSRPGVLNPLSRVTVASLADLGYVVDVTAAEAYALPEHLESAIAGAVPQFRRHCLPTIPFSAE
jgi:hypothetical protein